MNLSNEYDRIYREASEILKDHNPCAITGSMACAGCPLMGPARCCSGCKHQGKRGQCKVKSLACKAWICQRAALKSPEAAAKLRAIVAQAVKLGIFLIRASKAQALKAADPAREVPSWAQMIEGSYGYS